MTRDVPVRALTFAMAVLAALGARAEGDAERGERIFGQCSGCHSLEPGENRAGPHLHEILGREAGSVSGFRYSRALAESGIVWDRQAIGRYVTDPRGTVPGTSMMIGLRNASGQDTDDLVSFLESRPSDG